MGALWHSTLTLNMICLSGSQIFSRMGRSSGFLLMTGSAVKASRDCELDHVARRACGSQNAAAWHARAASRLTVQQLGAQPAMALSSRLMHAPASPSLYLSRKNQQLANCCRPKAKTAGIQKRQLTHRLKHLLHSLQQHPELLAPPHTHSQGRSSLHAQMQSWKCGCVPAGTPFGLDRAARRVQRQPAWGQRSQILVSFRPGWHGICFQRSLT